MADLSRRARILVIEDDPIIALTLRLLLTQLGHSVIGPFTTATQARRAMYAEPIDLALLDLQFDEETAFSLAASLSESRVSVAFLTGYADKELPDSYRYLPLVSNSVGASELERVIQSIMLRSAAAARPPC